MKLFGTILLGLSVQLAVGSHPAFATAPYACDASFQQTSSSYYAIKGLEFMDNLVSNPETFPSGQSIKATQEGDHYLVELSLLDDQQNLTNIDLTVYTHANKPESYPQVEIKTRDGLEHSFGGLSISKVSTQVVTNALYYPTGFSFVNACNQTLLYLGGITRYVPGSRLRFLGLTIERR